MTDPGLVMPSGATVGARAAPGPSGTVVYDYGVLHAGDARALHCPCGRTDNAGRAEDVIAAHLAGAPGIRAPGNGAARDARSDGLAPPARAGRPPDPGSTTIARTA